MLHFEPRLRQADTIYEHLVALHAGLGDEASHRANARLILILANQIGDDTIVLEAIGEAARACRPASATHFGDKP